MSLTTRPAKGHAEAGSMTTRGDCTAAPSRPDPSITWAQRLTQLSQGAWGAALVRTASVGLTLLGLAAIGSASLGQSLAQAFAHAPASASAGASSTQANMLQANILSAAGAAATTTTRLTQAATSAEPNGHAMAESAPPNPSGANNAGAGNADDNHPTTPGAPAPSPEPGLTGDGKIILNTATAAQLDKLPSVGLKRAEQIVALRERLGGRFKSLNDLLRIKGIGVRTLKKMLPMLVLDSPEDPTPPKQPAPPATG